MFRVIHLVRKYLVTDFSTPQYLYAPVQLRTYLMNGLFLNQKTNNNVRISFPLKYKHSKKNKFIESHPRPKILHLISVMISHIKGYLHYKTFCHKVALDA